MRDWQIEIGDRMGGLKLCSEARRDVVRELASHFEEIYDDARERGAGEQEAREQALESVRDWKRFASEVQREKETLMTTTPFRRQVMYPGVLALGLSGIAMWMTSLLFRQGAQYIFYVVGDPRTYFTFNIPWLVSLPIAGAAGAWMSWRGGGSGRQRALAAVFPHAAMLAWLVFIMLVIIPISLVVKMTMGVGPHISSEDLSVTVWAVRLYKLFTPWVIVPAVASTVGALPFLWLKPHAEEHPNTEAHA